MQIMTLQDLTGDGEKAFRQAFAEKTRWSRPAAIDGDAAAGLFSFLTIDRLLASGTLAVDQLRVLVSGTEAMPSLYTDAGGLRLDAIQSFLRQGATLSLNDIGRCVPAIGALAAAIERALGVRCGVNAYVTIGDKAAFRPHSDGHDVLVLQCYGAKRWYSHGEPQPYPLVGAQIGQAPAPVWDQIMVAGDLLYLPRGEVHSTLPERAPSVHLTFGLTEPTGVDLLRWLVIRAADDPVLRRDLGSTISSAERAPRIAAVKAALHALIDDISVEAFFDDQRSSRELLPFVNAAQGCMLDPTMVLTSALRRPVDLKTDVSGEAVVVLGGRPSRLSALSRRLLAIVTAEHRIMLGALAAAVGAMPTDAEFAEALTTLLQMALIGVTD
jgi:hypothetical protein